MATLCSTHGCAAPVFVQTRRLCRQCYDRWWRYAPNRKEKTCSEPECNRKHYGKGYCNKHWQQAYAAKPRKSRDAALYQKVKHKVVGAARLKAIGVSVEAFDAAKTAQHNKCAACENVFDGTRGGKAVADHDHSTGLFRGVLCSGCNLFLGHYEKKAHLLGRFAAYLQSPPAETYGEL